MEGNRSQAVHTFQAVEILVDDLLVLGMKPVDGVEVEFLDGILDIQVGRVVTGALAFQGAEVGNFDFDIGIAALDHAAKCRGRSVVLSDPAVFVEADEDQIALFQFMRDTPQVDPVFDSHRSLRFFQRNCDPPDA